VPSSRISCRYRAENGGERDYGKGGRIGEGFQRQSLRSSARKKEERAGGFSLDRGHLRAFEFVLPGEGDSPRAPEPMPRYPRRGEVASNGVAFDALLFGYPTLTGAIIGILHAVTRLSFDDIPEVRRGGCAALHPAQQGGRCRKAIPVLRRSRGGRFTRVPRSNRLLKKDAASFVSSALLFSDSQ